MPPRPEYNKILRRVPALAALGSHLAITGGPGTGKSFLAHCIHGMRPREARLVVLNAATMSEREIRVGLFGADLDEDTPERVGALERPGNLILKHFDRTPEYLQNALAESLNTNTTKRSLRGDPRPAACRLFFTLHHTPEDLDIDGRITRPLYHVAACLPGVHLPPLRSRPEEVGEFLEQYLPDGRTVRIDAAAYRQRIREFLLCQDWQENITELKAYLRTLVPRSFEEAWEALEHREVERVIMLIEEERELSLPESMAKIQQNLFRRALSQMGGHTSRASRLLGIHPYTLRLSLRRATNAS
jgi:DNA-binding NtrC family response regulator